MFPHLTFCKCIINHDRRNVKLPYFIYDLTLNRCFLLPHMRIPCHSHPRYVGHFYFSLRSLEIFLILILVPSIVLILRVVRSYVLFRSALMACKSELGSFIILLLELWSLFFVHWEFREFSKHEFHVIYYFLFGSLYLMTLYILCL